MQKRHAVLLLVICASLFLLPEASARYIYPACYLHSECDPLYCVSNICMYACIADRECTSDARCIYRAPGHDPRPIRDFQDQISAGTFRNYEHVACELPDGARVPPYINRGIYLRPGEIPARTNTCTLNTDCAGNQACIARTCHSQCLENRDCGTGLICVSDSPGSAGPVYYWPGCDQNPQYNRCALPDSSIVTPRCVPLSGPSRTYLPYHSLTGPRCYLNSDCAPNQRCNTDVGACIEQCHSARDCGRGEICSYRGRDVTVIDLDANPLPTSPVSPSSFVCERPPPPPPPPSRTSSGSATFVNIADGQATLTDGVNLPGGDYRNFRAVNDRSCLSACVYEPRCRAWTYVRGTTTCWLKFTSDLPQVNDPCCVSGYKMRDATPPATEEDEIGGEERERALEPPPVPSVSFLGGLFNAIGNFFSGIFGGGAKETPMKTQEKVLPKESQPTPPLEPPRPVPFCGNKVCDKGEDAKSCPSDCAPVQYGPVCGDYICDKGEDSKSCPSDCAPVQYGPVCGDYICDKGEDSKSCPSDCSPVQYGPVCGDYICDRDEDWKSCSVDCKAPVPSGPICGDYVCGKGEDWKSCPSDCAPAPSGPVCGDYICDKSEDSKSCSVDCQVAP